jgi:hypothetical protein
MQRLTSRTKMMDAINLRRSDIPDTVPSRGDVT